MCHSRRPAMGYHSAMGTGGMIVAAAGGALVVAVLAAFLVSLYNSLVQVRNNVQKAWSNIDILLQQRHDELPSLVEVCKGYMVHERETLEKVAQLRGRFDAAATVEDKTALENELNLFLLNLRGRVESYPDLKANANFLKLQDRITALESQIADRREFFNDSVNLYNIKIERFPELLFARLLGFARREFLLVPEASKAKPAVDFRKDGA